VKLWEIPADAALPMQVEALGVPIRVEAVDVAPGANGVLEASVAAQLAGSPQVVSLACAPGATAPGRCASVRDWTIGPHRFRADLVVYRVAVPVEAGRRPQVWLALLSRRE
jgi:hypothetical protein